MSPPGRSKGTVSLLTVFVDVNYRTLTKTLTFNRPVTPTEASVFLFGNAGRAHLLKPVGAAGPSGAQRYVLETRNVEAIMSLRPDVRDAVIRGGVLRSNAAPYDMPNWVPGNVKEDIRSGRVPRGVTRYKTQGDWGDIVVWKGNASVEIYQEFPGHAKFYEGIAGDGQQARLLHFAYTQYNKDMQYFVETKGMSPDNARSEIRRINEEVFKLILEGAVALLTTGASITQVSNAMAANARQVADATKRWSRMIASAAPKLRPLNGKVNVGGGFETPNMTNLNPVKPGSGGPTTDIPNHVVGGMEQMDELFEHGSVEFMMSSKLRYVDVNWEHATRAAANAMGPGGRVEMNVWCSGSEAAELKAAFERAGFRNVTITGDGVGTMLSATR